MFAVMTVLNSRKFFIAKLLSVAIISLLAFNACSRVPSNDEIKIQVAKNVLENEQDKIFIFKNFTKTNGFEQEDGSYIAEVSYDLVFRKGIEELSQELENTNSPLAAIGAGVEIMTKLLKYGQFKAGDRISYKQKFKFIKTEQGWRLANEFNL